MASSIQSEKIPCEKKWNEFRYRKIEICFEFLFFNFVKYISKFSSIPIFYIIQKFTLFIIYISIDYFVFLIKFLYSDLHAASTSRLNIWKCVGERNIFMHVAWNETRSRYYCYTIKREGNQ